MAILRHSVYFSCPNCKTQGKDNFEEKNVVRLSPSNSGGTSFEIASRVLLIVCRTCNHTLREQAVAI